MLNIQKTIMNKKGERLIFDNIKLIDDSFYLTETDNKFGVLNLDGIEIVPASYDEIQLTAQGFYLVKRNNLCGLFNADGKLLLSALYDTISISEYGFFIVKRNNLCGLFNSDGILRLPLLYDNIYSTPEESIVIIVLNKKCGFFDLSTNITINPIYDSAEYFLQGIAKVSKNGLYGYINKKGVEVIAVKYNHIYEFYANKAKTEINNKYGYVKKDGTEILPAEYDSVSSSFEYGFGFARRGNLNICFDTEGNIVFTLVNTTGIISSNVDYQKTNPDWCEEYFEFECGLIVLKQNDRFHCTTSNNIPLVTF